MSAFTDDDLKRLKEEFQDTGHPRDAQLISLGVMQALLARLEAAEDIQNGERCEACPDQGWYGEMHGGVDPDGENDTREAVQVQCQFCYENPKSVFNKVLAWLKSKGLNDGRAGEL